MIMLIPLGSALELVHPFLLKRIMDHHLKVGVADGLGIVALLYIIAFIAIQGVMFLQIYVSASVGQNALRDLRIRLFRHIGQLPISYFDKVPTGDTISRCTADVDSVGMLFSSTILGIFSQLVRIGGIVVAMIVLSAKLALVGLMAVPIVAIISRLFQKRMLAAERRIRLRVSETNVHLQETLTGMEIIRTFGQETTTENRFRRIQDGFLKAADRSSLYDSVFSPVIETIRAISIAFLIWYGTRSSVFLSWGITLGTLAAFIQLLNRFFGPITALGQEYQTVQQAVAGAERIFQILEIPIEQRPDTQQVTLRQVTPDLEIRGATFGYVTGQPVLRDINLHVGSGEHLAIVGPTGAGKSSMMHLIAGLYAPEMGTVCIGGIDPRRLAPEQRRRIIGVVPQQVYLLEGSLLDNLRLGDATVSEDDVWAALELANALKLVKGLPEGLHTPLGAYGVQLSSGQRQLISLARALVNNPRLLLLDEATSSVDSETEQLIRGGLTRSSAGRTTITVAHRMTSAQESDRVIVVVDGRIVEEGSPADLASAGGWYAGMLELQRLGWARAIRSWINGD
jgi:ATP-binding cassette subfamily B multidrug efflux pump